MYPAYDPIQRWRTEEDERRREERDAVVQREAFARDAGDPRWGTGGLCVDERGYRAERDARARRELAAVWSERGARRDSTAPGPPPHAEWPSRPEWETSYAHWSYEHWESIRGPYAGVGPRGYRRSDERIREDVCERFTEHGQLDPSDVEVSVREGEVLLTGTVATRAQKRLAEDIADLAFGVVEVHNHLHVQRPIDVSQMPRGAPVANDRPAHPAHAGTPGHR
jgi:hypothetical protein